MSIKLRPDELVAAQDLICMPQDIVKAGFCVRAGAMSWFVAHGFSFRKFMTEGLAAVDVIATGDAHGISVVRAALARQEKEKHGKPQEKG